MYVPKYPSRMWNIKKSKKMIFPDWTTTSSTSYEKAILICHLVWPLLQEKITAELPTMQQSSGA